MHAGNNRAVTGGYASLMPAHESQLFPIPEGVGFDQAVLADPFSVDLHAILKAPPADGAWPWSMAPVSWGSCRSPCFGSCSRRAMWP